MLYSRVCGSPPPPSHGWRRCSYDIALEWRWQGSCWYEILANSITIIDHCLDLFIRNKSPFPFPLWLLLPHPPGLLYCIVRTCIVWTLGILMILFFGVQLSNLSRKYWHLVYIFGVFEVFSLNLQYLWLSSVHSCVHMCVNSANSCHGLDWTSASYVHSCVNSTNSCHGLNIS